MTLRECYAAMGGDYGDVVGRLRSESLVQKFVLKFLDDGSYALLCRSFEAKDRQEAFRAAHTIKGVCQNLALTRLGESSHQLTEALREQWAPEAEELMARVREDYRQTTEALREFAAQAGK